MLHALATFFLCAAAAGAPARIEIRALRAGAPAGLYRVRGYVAKVWVCPPCPQPARCKPCMRDHMVLSAVRREAGAFPLRDDELLVFAVEPKRFVVGKRVSLVVRVTGTKTTNEPYNDVEFIAPPGS